MIQDIENLFIEVKDIAEVKRLMGNGAHLETPDGKTIVNAKEIIDSLFVQMENEDWKHVPFVRLYSRMMSMQHLDLALRILNTSEVKADRMIAFRAIEVALKGTNLEITKGDLDYSGEWSIRWEAEPKMWVWEPKDA